MAKMRIWSLVFLFVGAGLWYSTYTLVKTNDSETEWFPFKLGLDLKGGAELTYKADTKQLKDTDVVDSMAAVRDLIERRVNTLGVSEPVVQTEVGRNGDQRLIVELPGVTDLNQAIQTIGATPFLQFKIERLTAEKEKILAEIKKYQEIQSKKGDLKGIDMSLLVQDPYYVDTELTGRYLKKAVLEFNQQSYEPVVSLEFDADGTRLFGEITKANVNKTVAIYLDNQVISTPVVRESITTGKAQISGNFTPQTARDLVGRLNEGALPVPITLVSNQTVGALLGDEVLAKDIWAGIMGTLIVALFLILWYRLPGLIASISLAIYVALMLAFFRLIPVTITAAGIAGFIMSIGMAVDANILIFERTKEELLGGHSLADAIKEGFARAWLSIRDSNISSIITAVVLFWLGTSLVKGFALTFGLGVVVSMFTAITVTRTFLFSFRIKDSSVTKFLFGHGLTK